MRRWGRLTYHSILQAEKDDCCQTWLEVTLDLRTGVGGDAGETESGASSKSSKDAWHEMRKEGTPLGYILLPTFPSHSPDGLLLAPAEKAQVEC
jgi:hypothetical protein